MGEVFVRALLAADYEAVVTLWRASEGIGLSKADEFMPICRYLERNPDMSLVAEADGKIIGAVLCGHDGRRGYLHHLAIAAEFRGQGIGQRLVRSCLEKLVSESIDKCHTLNLRATNEKRLRVRIYQSLRRMRHFTHWVNAKFCRLPHRGSGKW